MSQRWVYFFADGNIRRGPFTLEQLREYPLRAETIVWREGMPQWSTLRDVPELWAIFAERLVEPTQAFAETASPEQPVIAIPQTPIFPQSVVAGQALEYGAPPPPKNLAVTSLSLGIAGLVWLVLPGSILIGAPMSIAAIICGVIARRKAKRLEAGGEGMALVGLILGIVNVVIAAVITLMVGVLIVAFIANDQKKKSPNANPGPAPTSVPINR